MYGNMCVGGNGWCVTCGVCFGGGGEMKKIICNTHIQSPTSHLMTTAQADLLVILNI